MGMIPDNLKFSKMTSAEFEGKRASIATTYGENAAKDWEEAVRYLARVTTDDFETVFRSMHDYYTGAYQKYNHRPFMDMACEYMQVGTPKDDAPVNQEAVIMRRR
jgi:hypothetical protein